MTRYMQTGKNGFGKPYVNGIMPIEYPEFEWPTNPNNGTLGFLRECGFVKMVESYNPVTANLLIKTGVEWQTINVMQIYQHIYISNPNDKESGMYIQVPRVGPGCGGYIDDYVGFKDLGEDFSPYKDRRFAAVIYGNLDVEERDVHGVFDEVLKETDAIREIGLDQEILKYLLALPKDVLKYLSPRIILEPWL